MPDRTQLFRPPVEEGWPIPGSQLLLGLQGPVPQASRLSREPWVRNAVLAEGSTPHRVEEQQFEMRARLTSLLLATAWAAGVGCASKPAEERAAAAPPDQACATSHIASQPNDHDTAIDSILSQPTSDPRLAQINRRMYQSLRALDAELRREQRLAACEPHPIESPLLQARTNNNEQNASGGGAAAGDAGVTAGAAVGGTARATANGAIAPSGLALATSGRKSSLSANGGGGNGATAPKVVAGSDNDIVARRLRKAAEQETNPALRAKLWKEYTDYRQGTSAK